MTEVTRVPLQPIAKGSLTKLWLAVIAALLLAGGAAWAAMPEGVTVDVVREGQGPHPAADDVVFVKYTGKLADGTVFDQSQPLPIPVQGIFPEGTPLPLSDMIPGFREALVQTREGGQYEIFIPSESGYGDQVPPGGPIPPDADLSFDVEVMGFMSRPEFEQRVQLLQQRVQQMGGFPGAPGGAGGAGDPDAAGAQDLPEGVPPQ
ncbi:FKBP-type peptidyl-prolyl cis-trans isomerase [Aurantiacibacter spongiae]|uniref:Peptidyl-prolyl cis-trans isomerase n=1 Tax=Aurantiacibacter spongiae TaxID=2488860 RepID=A0A3N5DJV6_9SPHN|nr:FKBP-type peptidyl-prolyl cis-trans isomerase [Aurantiacibacter spongiae]RPF71992.1 peptidylprolyl isomerase [Aurantiacibacter spongiae]